MHSVQSCRDGSCNYGLTDAGQPGHDDQGRLRSHFFCCLDVEPELDHITTPSNNVSVGVQRAVMYLRISLDHTGEGLAVARQRDECARIIGQRGWKHVGEYVDNSVSASDARKNRPGYDALVKAYEAGEFDALVCYDLDRLTRQPCQLEDWIDAAEGRGLALVTANGEADLTTDGAACSPA